MKYYFLYSLITFILLSSCKQEKPEIAATVVIEKKPEIPLIQYGFDLNKFYVLQDTVQSGDTFSTLLDKHLVAGQDPFKIAAKMDSVYSLRRIKAGAAYTILKRKDSLKTPAVFIYESSKMDYIVLRMADSVVAWKQRYPIKLERRVVGGEIKSSLSQAMAAQGLGPSTVNQLSEIYKWTLDFFKVRKGDKFKVIVTERWINDTIYGGIVNMEAAVFVKDNKPYYAFDYVTDSIADKRDYYNDKGAPLKNFFLKAPVDFTRISSKFSSGRVHPVTGVLKAHNGTDYAAPHGTPIVSTADGVVVASSYTSGNGNFVKVKHNKTYTTQYLHMSKRLVQNGQRVSQGQTIGLVGSTGLATGPHICYRFWVNDKQVDALAQKLPNADPLPKGELQNFLSYVTPLKKELDDSSFGKKKVSEKKKTKTSTESITTNQPKNATVPSNTKTGVTNTSK